jgi:hypothetical protein
MDNTRAHRPRGEGCSAASCRNPVVEFPGLCGLKESGTEDCNSKGVDFPGCPVSAVAPIPGNSGSRRACGGLAVRDLVMRFPSFSQDARF